jgi:protein involved in polysaccharide export with SLBB domain
MRVIRSFILCLGMAIAAAGCAREPVAYVAYPSAGMGGIDNMVYGDPAMMGGGYAPAQSGAYGTALYGYAGNGYAPAATAGGYPLDSGDRMRIVVFGQEGLTNSYVVGAGGYIDMPLIGSVAARGLTTDQLASRISDKLRDGFIREPHVAVEIEAYRPFFILGEVNAPGQYPYVANMTVETAVAIAGGFGPRASRKSAVLTRNYYGRQIRMAVPLTFPLRPGDTVSVQERWL